MNRKAFFVTMGITLVLGLVVLLIGACVASRSVKEIEEIDTFIEEITSDTSTFVVVETKMPTTVHPTTPATTETTTEETSKETEPYHSVLNHYDGINYYNGVLETYYCLPMDGVVEWMHSLGYEGEYWVREDGCKMLGEYIMVAADYEWMPKGSIVETSLGTAMVCDTGEGGWYWFDIATNWDE